MADNVVEMLREIRALRQQLDGQGDENSLLGRINRIDNRLTEIGLHVDDLREKNANFLEDKLEFDRVKTRVKNLEDAKSEADGRWALIRNTFVATAVTVIAIGVIYAVAHGFGLHIPSGDDAAKAKDTADQVQAVVPTPAPRGKK